MQIISFSKTLSSICKALYHKELTRNQSLNQFIPDSFLYDFSNQIKRCLKPELLAFERTITFPAGKTYNLQIKLNPIVLDNNIPYILICIQNNYKNRALRKQNKALTRYAMSTSHKLRNPIRNIQVLSDKLNESNEFAYDPDLIKKLLKDISLQAELLDSIISSLKTLINENSDNRMAGQLSVKKFNSIVLVDDEPIVNMMHHKMITSYRSSIKIHSFTDAMAALIFVEANPPDLITLDINMPVINGWQFLHLLEAKEIDIDVVIISSSIDQQERRKAFTFKNVKHFLVKPLTRDDINLIIK